MAFDKSLSYSAENCEFSNDFDWLLSGLSYFTVGSLTESIFLSWGLIPEFSVI